MHLYLLSSLNLIFTILLLGLIGGFVVIPFRKNLPFALWVAPQVGILTAIAGSVFCYSFLYVSLYTGIKIAASITILITLGSIIYHKLKFPKHALSLIIFSLFTVLFINWICNSATFIHHALSFTFMHGTDHLGYAQLADWITNHPHETPMLSAKEPYQSWPYFAFNSDPRFGTYYFLSMIAQIYHVDGMFAYDIACAIILSCITLGLSGLFARSRFTFFVLLLVFLTSIFYALSMSGYFGKIMGYPAIFLLLGLFLTAERFSPWQVICLACIAAVCSGIYPATASIFLVSLFYFIYITSFYLFPKKDKSFTNPKDKAALFLLIIAVLIFATGFMGRPLFFGDTLKPDVFEVNVLKKILMGYIGPDRNADHFIYSQSSKNLQQLLFNFLSAVTLLLPILAIKRKNPLAFSFLIYPVVIGLLLIVTKKNWTLYQLSGLVYPLQAIGLVMLYENERNKPATLLSFRYLILIILACLILIHSRSFLGAMKTYNNIQTNGDHKFYQDELNRLTQEINNEVLIDVKINMFTIPLLVEVAKNQDLNVYWSPEAWKATFGYHPEWPVPKMRHAAYVIRLLSDSRPMDKGCTWLDYTTQYVLLKCD